VLSLNKEGIMSEHFDVGTSVVIAITFVLFVLALFIKGFTHDLLLEAGVFLVSLKLILMAYKSSVTTNTLLNELQDIKKTLELRND
jgi:hypothetical protein